LRKNNEAEDDAEDNENEEKEEYIRKKNTLKILLGSNCGVATSIIRNPEEEGEMKRSLVI